LILRFVLDTNVLSEPLKPNPRPAILRRLERFREGLATSAPVWHELVFGCMRLPPSARRQALERYIKDTLAPSLPVLPYDADAAAWHAGERARLEALGKTPPFVDGQIAAVARVRGLVLVTRNVSDYADFEGLLIDDWAA
jgi:tRNA(fMet)-specific endonuclease VapC